MPIDPDALTRLTVALDGLASALESGDPDRVLAAEAPLGTAVSALRYTDLGPLAGRTDARAAILQARLALARCRTLGHAAGRMTAIVTANGYGPSGHHRPQPVPVSTVTTRT